jgi:hypothetical protein
LINEVPNHCVLTAADRAASVTRQNEEMWEQQVRNITSHHANPGNFIHEGYLTRIKDGLEITAAGRAHLLALGA